MAALEYFTVSYDAKGVTRDGPDEDFLPDMPPMSCNVEFVYRVPPGFAFRASTLEPRPTDLGFGGFVARVDEGRLKHLNGNVDYTLPANTAVLEWPYGPDLYIDVVFTNVVYSRARRPWNNFAFKCPTEGDTTVNLTTVERYPFLAQARYGEWFQNKRYLSA